MQQGPGWAEEAGAHLWLLIAASCICTCKRIALSEQRAGPEERLLPQACNLSIVCEQHDRQYMIAASVCAPILLPQCCSFIAGHTVAVAGITTSLCTTWTIVQSSSTGTAHGLVRSPPQSTPAGRQLWAPPFSNKKTAGGLSHTQQGC